MKYYNIHTHLRQKEQDTVIFINYNVGEFGSFCGLDLQYSFYTLGLHPWTIREEDLSKNIDFIEHNACFESVKAIGECGFDKLCQTPWDIQEKAFIAQVLISEKLKKPLIIHCVKAFNELIAVKKLMNPKQIWIIHGFRGKPQQMEQLLHQGFYFSCGFEFNPETLKSMPMERLFFETDDMEVRIEEVYVKASQILQIDLNDLLPKIGGNVKNIFFDT